MPDFTYWNKRNSTILNSIGTWKGGEDVTIEGHSLMNDLIGNISYMQLHILNATGKLVDKNIADWIEICFMGVSYPDSRIWCNQIAAYAGDTNSTVSTAASLSILAADSRAYGGSQTKRISMAFQKDAYLKYGSGMTIKQIVNEVKFKNGKPIIVGFARPIDRDDERLAPFIANQKKLNIPQGKYLTFALQLSTYLNKEYNLSINCGGYSSAFLLDQGFTPKNGYAINAFSVVSGAVACFRNQEEQTPNSFLPMKCEDVDYTGTQIRKVLD